jgi:hypothetical protein
MLLGYCLPCVSGAAWTAIGRIGNGCGLLVCHIVFYPAYQACHENNMWICEDNVARFEP